MFSFQEKKFRTRENFEKDLNGLFDVGLAGYTNRGLRLGLQMFKKESGVRHVIFTYGLFSHRVLYDLCVEPRRRFRQSRSPETGT